MRDRLTITLALLACIAFSAFLIGLQQKQETDRQEYAGELSERQQETRNEESGPPVIRTRLWEAESGDKPVFSLPGGFYPEEITVEITAPAGSRIYYTVDGSTPDAENGILYEEPVKVTNVCGSPNVYSAISTVSAYQEYAPLTTVDKAFILQAVAVNDRGETSGVTCGSYFVAMEEKAMYRGLPVLSVTTDPAGLFDYFEGNYVTGVDYENALAADELRFDSANYYRGGEIPAHIEYFEADRYLTCAEDVTLSLRKDGNLDFGQKSFFIKGEVPEKTSELYDFLKDGVLILYGGGRDYAAKSRQCLEEELLREQTGFSMGEMKGCMVFVDGEFWGLYLLRRGLTRELFAGNCGCSPEEIRLVENSYPSQTAPELQELYRLVTEQDAAQPGIWQRILALMDTGSYLDYYCAGLYFGNPQFDSFSTTVWRQEDGDGGAGKWCWEFNDATDTLGCSKLSNYSVNTYLCPGVSGDLFLQGLLRNPEFAEAFRDRMRQYAEELTEEKAAEKLTPLLEQYRVAVAATVERYGLRQTEEGYLNDGDRILEYFASRGEYILRYTDEFLKTIQETEGRERGTTYGTNGGISGTTGVGGTGGQESSSAAGGDPGR